MNTEVLQRRPAPARIFGLLGLTCVVVACTQPSGDTAMAGSGSDTAIIVVETFFNKLFKISCRYRHIAV